MKLFFGAAILSIVCLSFIDSPEPKEFEGVVKYSILEGELASLDFTEVDYYHKGEMHRYDFKGANSQMSVFAMDGSPYWTVCMEWMGEKVAFTENYSKTCGFTIDQEDSEESKKHHIGYDDFDMDFIGSKKYRCPNPLVDEGDSTNPNSNEKVDPLPLKFHLCLNDDCFYLESNKIQEKELEESMFDISEDYVFLTKEELGDLYGEMSSDSSSK
ncbi:MAG: hypothetical protein HRT74_00980 [Flavobacteriales bacterium]|nr:hypothetical protein [Flavobacteriales bacterium]